MAATISKYVRARPTGRVRGRTGTFGAALMLRVVMLCTGLLGAPPAEVAPAPTPTAEDRKAYEAASQGAGRDAAAHVRLALWCEEHGLDAERLKHLAIAVITDPANTAARG